MKYHATYSPEDNKLRLYASARLDRELYERVKAAGFRWAPVQECFVAPMWTPERAELCEELAGEIGDEDRTLMDRAEDRAERFDGYSENRARDANAAREAVDSIAQRFELGQPILIGHHSERKARRDAEKIENGMRRAVKMWETSQYWQDRAASAIRHARYKERPDVRARRIRNIEADLRKVEKSIAAARVNIRIWTDLHDDAKTTLKKKDGTPGTFKERALHCTNGRGYGYGLWSDLEAGRIMPEEAQSRAIAADTAALKRGEQWAEHYRNRLTYERAMLAAEGGTVADRTGPEVGGGCRCWASPRGGWSYIKKVNKVSVTLLDNWHNGGRNFTRTIPFDKLAAIMTRAQVEEAREAGRLRDISAGGEVIGFDLAEGSPDRITKAAKPEPKAEAADFAAMRETLRNGGVQVVTAPQLFPTPPDLAARMVELADVRPGHRVLEPSAGTGAILDALNGHAKECAHVVAVEINPTLGGRLDDTGRAVVIGDFLKCDPETLWGAFDRVLMNPPFENGADIRHIRHAAGMLKPGGRLVAICANGPRQREALQPIASHWEELPAGTFKAAGTMVNAALLVIEEGAQ